MSCLYPSLEFSVLDCCRYSHTGGMRWRTPDRSAFIQHRLCRPFSKSRVQQDALPHASVTRRHNQIMQPAKTSTGFSREFPGAISGFRSLCGREQRSSLSHRAQSNLPFGTFHSGRALALRTLAFTRSTYGASNPGPMLYDERSRIGR